MGKFVISPHFRLQEWVGEEKGYFAAEGLDYEFRDNYGPGEAAVKAVQAGVDLLILSSDLARQQQARDELVAAVRDGRIKPERLEQALRNVLTVKARFGLLGTPAPMSSGCP